MMGSLNSRPANAGAMPLAVWRGEKGQRLRRALSRHVTSSRLIQLNKRYDRIILAALTWVPR